MVLKVVDDGQFRDIRIEEGEMFLLPGASPVLPPLSSRPLSLISMDPLCLVRKHAAQPLPIRRHDRSRRRARPTTRIHRSARLLVLPRSHEYPGLTVKSLPGPCSDSLQWYCQNRDAHPDGPHIIYKESFHVTDLGSQLKPVIEVRPPRPAPGRCDGDVADQARRGPAGVDGRRRQAHVLRVWLCF